MNDQKNTLPPPVDTAKSETSANPMSTPPPIPQKRVAEESSFRRVLRYTVSIVLLVAALIGIVTLYTFVHDVLMDEQNTVETGDIHLQQYVINQPPVDTRRSHVRMKPGSHPEAGYIADESVLIREREEDARFREQNGQHTTEGTQKPSQTDKPRREESARSETLPTPATSEHTTSATTPVTPPTQSQHSETVSSPVSLE